MALANPRGNGAEGRREWSINDLISSQGALSRFEAYAPPGVDARRLLKLAALAVQTTPDLLKCNPMETLRAMVGVASLGLEINSPLGHAYLIPFGGRIEVIIGYQGYLELIYRSGKVDGIRAGVATERERDEGLFQYKLGTKAFIDHLLDPQRDEDADDIAFAYAVAHFTNGHEELVVLPWGFVERIRNRSSGYRFALSKGENSKAFQKSPWNSDRNAMAMKTAIRQLQKYLPKTADIGMAVALDEGGERGADLSLLVDLDPAQWTRTELGPARERKTAGKPSNGNGDAPVDATADATADEHGGEEKPEGARAEPKAAAAPADDGAAARHPAADEGAVRVDDKNNDDSPEGGDTSGEDALGW